MGFFAKLFRKEKEKHIMKLDAIADKIEALESKYQSMTDDDLRNQTPILKERLNKGESLDDILVDSFAVVREASKRVLNMRHYKVQLIGGIVLHQGRIAEMKTGEGKTLVATLPAYLNALNGLGVHIVTVNDYLAERDAEWMGKVYKFLGLTVGCIINDMKADDKKAAYACDITYGTNNEIGFDYLRDNMATELEKVMQRGHQFAIIDEVDSILIDEARTPLIISAPAGESGDLYVSISRFVAKLDAEDYIMDEKDKHIYLSEDGVERAEKFFKIANLGDADNAELLVKINTALKAHFLMHRDKDYIVESGKVMIVDEFTGRKMEGRRYSSGLHQSIEAKENVTIKKENKTIATITFQNLFRMYKKLSGMTGTAMTEEGEFKGIYSLDVVEIPPNLPMVRNDEADKVFMDKEKKYAAVIEEIEKCFKLGQPILVGTINVDVSELLSRELYKKRIPHNVLNAKSNVEEAFIIAQAGRKNAVTIATNMAGRGTDILLGGNPEYQAKQKMKKEGFSDELISIANAYNNVTEDKEVEARKIFKDYYQKFKIETDAEKAEVKTLGGLMVLGTERHESRRIDNQLRGRSGRQGDEGRSCFFLSFEDDLLRLFGGDRMKALVSTLTRDDNTTLQFGLLSKQIESAQKRCEEGNYQRRKYVLNYDDVMNNQRKLIYAQRNEVLNGADVHEQIIKFLKPVCQGICVDFASFAEGDEDSIDYVSFNTALEQRILKEGTNIVDKDLCSRLNTSKVTEAVFEEATKQYDAKIAFGQENGIDFKSTERNVLLNCVDKHWMDHIDAMDALRKGIGLRGYAQRDPVIEYRREGFTMFDEMIDSIQKTTVVTLCRLDVQAFVERRNAFQSAVKQVVQVVNASKTPGRNDSCPCGSGRKYKVCCGK